MPSPNHVRSLAAGGVILACASVDVSSAISAGEFRICDRGRIQGVGRTLRSSYAFMFLEAVRESAAGSPERVDSSLGGGSN